MFLLLFNPEHLSKQLTAERVAGRGRETEQEERRERDWSRKEWELETKRHVAVSPRTELLLMKYKHTCKYYDIQGQ